MSCHAALSPRKLNLASAHEAAAIAPCGRGKPACAGLIEPMKFIY